MKIPAFRCGILVALLALLCFPAIAVPPANPRQAWQLLDYLAVDYGAAVQGGKVISASEYAEMREFSEAVRAQLAALPSTPGQSQLVAQADRLIAAIAAKSDAVNVANLAHGLADALLVSYPVDTMPRTPPDLSRATALYAAQCAACHGPSGHGDGPLAGTLDPPPIAFSDAARAARRSPFALHEAISQGIQGTAMASFSSLPDPDRWALAFYVGTLSYSPQMQAEGEILWKQDPAWRRQVSTLEILARTSQIDLVGAGSQKAQAQAVLAYLRTHPEKLARMPPSEGAPKFTVARQRMADSVVAYQSGDVSRAKSTALSAYLDGVEPVEPLLATRDAALLREIETAMAGYRSQLGQGAPSTVVADAAAIDKLFDRAEAALQETRTDKVTAFLGSFTILVREGLEALLIVIGIIAFLRKAERKELLPYVHGGWIGALLVGGATWVAATYALDISGANREVTEGVSALFAAAVLLSVGIWMHQKSLAGRWQQYLHAKMSVALTRRSAIFLFILAFVAVYREVFETILFYIAMWNERASSAILSGLAAGVVVLAGIAYWMLRMSKRLPIGRFFSISSIFIAVLAVILVGKGVAALQEAGMVPQTLLQLPRIEWLGVYPSWQSLSAQLIVLAAAIAGFLFNARVGAQAKA